MPEPINRHLHVAPSAATKGTSHVSDHQSHLAVCNRTIRFLPGYFEQDRLPETKQEEVMNLLLQRAQRRSFFGAIEYMLHVTIIVDANEEQTIVQHGLTRNELYALPEIETHLENAQRAFSRADKRSLLRTSDAGKMVIDTIAGLVHVSRAKLSYVLTVADALVGTTITCRDLRQLVTCEETITSAFDKLNEDIENAIAFATGREEVFAPENAPEPEGLPPAAWGNRQQWWRAR